MKVMKNISQMIGSNSRIWDISLLFAEAKCFVDPLCQVPEMKLMDRSGLSVRANLVGKFTANITLGVKLVNLHNPSRVLYFFEATYMIVYGTILHPAEVTKEEVEQFCKVNARFHVWPFFREEVNRNFGRMKIDYYLPFYLSRDED